MSSENFKQALIQQYSAVIEEIIVESEIAYRTKLDFTGLDTRVCGLIQAARVDGLEENIIWDILERRVPDYYNFAMNKWINSKIAA